MRERRKPKPPTIWRTLLSEKRRLGIRQTVLNLGKIQRIHIVGAARSGTTMLHCAMAAFQNTVINSRESTTIWDPSLSRAALLAAGNVARRAPVVFVTKRDYGWFRDDYLQELLHDVLAGDIGLIHIVRDPRDALTSLHAGKSQDEYYLEPERWLASTTAGEWLCKRLENHPRKMTLRYEDLIFKPEVVRGELESRFSLTLREGITDWSRLSESVANIQVSSSLRTALHQVRDFDAQSVGKWKRNAQQREYFQLLLHGEYGDALRSFMDLHGYRHDAMLLASENR